MPNDPPDSETRMTKMISEYRKVTERKIYRVAAARKSPGFKGGGLGASLRRRFINGNNGSRRAGRRWIRMPTQGEEMTTEQGVTNDQLERSLIEIAVESWRFSRLFSRVVNKLDAGEAGRYVNQLRYFQKKVEESLDASGLRLVNVEGQPFDPGMAASALNIGDFGPDDQLLVDQMVEPIIMGPEGLRKQGTVMLRKVHA
jgi:hypothetical protein